jgi:hypothetical protein
LPAIASFFNVNTDDLLGYQVAKKQERIDEYCKKYDNHFKKWKPATERVSLMREALAEFPAEEKLLCNLAEALYYEWSEEYGSYGKMDDGYPVKDCDKMKANYGWQEPIKIFESLLETSINVSIRQRSTQMLIFIYSDIGETKKALVLADKMSSMAYSKELMKPFAVEGKEKVVYVEKNVIDLLSYFYGSINTLLSLIDKNLELKKREAIYISLLSMYKVIFDDENYLFYHTSIKGIYLDMARMYAQSGDKEKTFESLESAFHHALKFDRLPKEKQKYTSTLCSDVDYKPDEFYKTDNSAIKGLLSNLNPTWYKNIKEDEKFKALIEKIEYEIK